MDLSIFLFGPFIVDRITSIINFMFSTDLKPSIYYVHKFFWKTNISFLVIRTPTCTYQGVTNVSFSEILVCTKWITPLVTQSSMLCDCSDLMKTYLLRCNELKDCLQFLFSYLANLSE